ncbi:MAG TPA: NADPH-dependent glutamate synthase [Firmicutes bacterium]|uniref:NADPH-dependent glutamate synthase n=1 Tax=Candidatus Fermentithermobacillus carboniphilus TaxID=3085328 RepID=A0AAT9LGG1_9FIRM|nr:MAG: NADPH-dependent glutamate synthase [Candidatus Fermentithermobacillus carboniphilus]HHW17926.1 NADPH-dependent glutamate synthase [Candidatus Fermentithermobacillaceae bacterium]
MPIKERTEMPVQDPKERIKNFSQVALGYTEEMALNEASRCLQCKNPTCMTGCPVAVKIPEFIKLLKEKKYQEAIDKIKETNNLPAICGRVCPQEHQCEAKCVLARRGQPVAIGRLERFVADWEHSHGKSEVRKAEPNGHRVAVVGSGPAGLTCAADLARLGYQVTIFESLHAPGGVLIYGIPEFRLPKDVVRREVEYVKSLGVKIETSVVIGRTLTIDDLFHDGYEAVFVGSGAGLPMFMHIPGENLNGVYSANEFLTRINLMKAYEFPEFDTPIKRGKRVAVVGAGNVAMDAVRCALRLGAEKAMILYRRGREEMPARAEEVLNAEEEGVEFHFLTNPVRILGDDKGWVTGVECIKMQLGEPDKSGRRRPIPIPGSEFVIEADTVIMALGTSPNPILAQTTEGLKAHPWGGLIADEKTGRTTRPRVWAGGDAVTGSATVILAMGAGKQAAKDIHEYISSGAQGW